MKKEDIQAAQAALHEALVARRTALIEKHGQEYGGTLFQAARASGGVLHLSALLGTSGSPAAKGMIMSMRDAVLDDILGMMVASIPGDLSDSMIDKVEDEILEETKAQLALVDEHSLKLQEQAQSPSIILPGN